jgi:aspartyl-tRNA(Asn)/glutamyl-tRNA(Gln) amidotransferase subunit A
MTRAPGPEVQALIRLGVDGLAAAVRTRSLDPQRVAAAFCDRLERVNPSLNAVVGYRRQAVMDEAVRLAGRLDGSEELPLAGVPFTVKDNLWVEGERIAQGSRLFAHHHAPRDAWAVARLREAGAVVLGITNTPEFACRGVTESPLHGLTRHPLDAGLTPGGSSGGAAASLAAGIGMFALGTDAGGSIRRPAAHCGLVGLKPSAGLVPHPWGFGEPNYGFSVVGLLARTVSDCKAVYRELTAYDAGDASAPPIRVDLFDDPLADPTRMRIAWSPALGCGFPVDEDVRVCLESRITELRESGLTIETADPEWPTGTGAYPLIALQQKGLQGLYAPNYPTLPPGLDPDIEEAIAQGARHRPGHWLALLRRLEAIRHALSRFFERYDLLLTPTAPVTAWPVGAWPSMIGGQQVGPRGHAAFTPLFNYCGVPAISLPAGDVRGLPVGLQAVAPRFEDARLLAWAMAAEALSGSAWPHARH